MRSLALVAKTEEGAAKKKKKRDRRIRGVFAGAIRAPETYGPMHVMVRVGDELWVVDCLLDKIDKNWERKSLVFTDADVFTVSARRALPQGRVVRLSPELAAKLEAKAHQTIEDELSREAAEESRRIERWLKRKE